MLLYNWSENENAWKIMRFQTLAALFIKNCQYFLMNIERHAEQRLFKSRQRTPYMWEAQDHCPAFLESPIFQTEQRSNHPLQGLISLLPREVEFLHKGWEPNLESLRDFHAGKANNFSVRHSSDMMALAWDLALYSTYWFSQICF